MIKAFLRKIKQKYASVVALDWPLFAMHMSGFVVTDQCGLLHYKYKYVFRAVGCFPGPYLAKRFTEVHIN